MEEIVTVRRSDILMKWEGGNVTVLYYTRMYVCYLLLVDDKRKVVTRNGIGDFGMEECDIE